MHSWLFKEWHSLNSDIKYHIKENKLFITSRNLPSKQCTLKKKKKNQCTVWCLAPGLYIGGALQVFAEWMTKSEGNYPSRKINGYFWYCYNYHLIGQVSGHWFKKLKLCCFISLSSMGKLKKACFKLIAIPSNDLDKILEMGSSGEGKVKYEVKCCDWRISIQAFYSLTWT